MNLDKLNKILLNCVKCTAEFEIYKNVNNWYLVSVFKNGYSHNQDLEGFKSNVEEVKAFCKRFEQEHNIVVKFISFAQ